jgi:ABC-type nitrate/sulfonate/bicarbonate transport system permease component
MNVAAARLTGEYRPPFFNRERFAAILPPAASLAAGVVLWQVVGLIWNQPFFPPFSQVLERLGELTAEDKILPNVLTSATNLAVGFTASTLVGVTLGVLMGVSRKVEMAFDVYVFALLTSPSLVFAPIFFAIFGFKQIQLIVLSIIFQYSAWIIVVNTHAAIRSTPTAMIEMGRSYCANERQLFFKIILPSALPLIFAGLRLGIGRAVKGMINGEMFIIAVGLGGIVMDEGQRFNAAGVFAVLLIIIVFSLVMQKLVQLIDYRVTSWLPSTARQARSRRS